MNRWMELRADMKPVKLLQTLAVGWLVAALLAVHCVSLASIVFAGPLQQFASLGVGMMLIGAVIFCLVVALSSSYRGMLAAPQEVPATVLGSLGAVVFASTAGEHDDAPFLTMVVLVVISAALTSLSFLLIGLFRISHLFRFIPFPVTAGFFAGSGWILCLAGIATMTGTASDWETLLRLDPSTVWMWGPGVLYCATMWFLMRRGGNAVLLLGSVLLVSAFYHLGLFLFDVSIHEAQAMGLLISGASEMGMSHDFSLGDLAHADWSVVFAQLPSLLSVVFVSLMCLLVYVNGLEVAAGVDIDLDAEFRAAGAAGLCAGAVGSVPGCQAFSLTLLGRMFGVDNRWLGIMVALALVLSLALASQLLELLPASIIGGLLLFIGVDLLDTWIIKLRKKLPWTDFGVIVLIFASIAAFGFLPGVGVGMLAMLALFAFRLSRVDAVAESFTLREKSSTTLRSVPDRTILWDRGRLVHGYRLRGYIFFGGAHPLVERLRQSLSTRPAPKWCLLDFGSVSGCDYSAAQVLGQFVRSANTAGIQTVISAADASLELRLREIVPSDARSTLWFEKDLDHGLERCEDMIIASTENERSDGAATVVHGQLLESVVDELEQHLREQEQFEELLEQLGPWLEPRQYEVGEMLAEHGMPQPGLQFVVSGVATLHDENGARFQQCGPSDVIEPWAAFTAQAASSSAIARTRCRTMLLAPSARERLEETDNDLCLKLFSYLIKRQALRL